MLSIQLLGPPSVTRDGATVRLLRRKSRALLFYIAAHPVPQTRERLLALFWPDHPRQAARQILRTTLHSLRKDLGSAIVVADETVALHDESAVDTRAFEAGLAAAHGDPRRLEATLGLYRGDFLAEFELDDASGFDAWVTTERQRLRNEATRGWIALAELHAAGQDYRAALRSIERALALDPLREEAQRAAIRLHYRAGDRAAAIRQYEHFRSRLDDELGVPPMAETTALYHAVVTDALEPPAQRVVASVRVPRTPPPVAAALPFVGRAAELKLLREPAAYHRLALLEGEPGIGKTRLALESIGGGEPLVLIATAHELERTLPYQPMIDAFRSLLAGPEWPVLAPHLDLPQVWLRELARLLPELVLSRPTLDPASEPADESRLWEAWNQLLQAIARQRPTVLLLDDLHWADASTLALLGYLVRQQTTAALRFVATARLPQAQNPLADLLRALTRSDLLLRLRLDRLQQDEIGALARHLSLREHAALAEWLAGATEGNPYILAEVIRAAQADHLLGSDGQFDHRKVSTSPLVPHTVYTLLQSRMAPLGDDARRLLHLAVAAGRDWEWEVVARAANLDDQRLFEVLDELQAAGLIHPVDATRYAFDHTLIMEVAYRELGEPRHRLMHRRLAEAMEQVYADRLDQVVGLLALHFLEGNAPDRAAGYALRAGRLAARLAGWTEAIAFFEQALAGSTAREHGPILMELGEAHLQAGAVDQAARSFQAALAAFVALPEPDCAEADAARLAVARTYLMRGQTADVIAYAREVRTAGRPESAALAEFMWGTALAHSGADLDAAIEHLEIAAALLQGGAVPTDTSLHAAVSLEIGNVAAQQGALRAAIAHYQVTLEISESAQHGPVLAWHILGHNNMAYHLHLLGEPEAIDHAREGLRLAHEKGMLSLQPYLLSTLGEIALAAGDLEGAEAHLQAGLAIAERLGSAERHAGITATLGRLDARRGQTERGVTRLRQALEAANQLGSHHLAAQIRLWLAPLLAPDEARASLREARAIAEQGSRRLLLDEIERLERELDSVGADMDRPAPLAAITT